jgi:hypothetical protein
VQSVLAFVDPQIQLFGILAVAEASRFDNLDNDDLATVLELARNHANARVREAATDLAERLVD